MKQQPLYSLLLFCILLLLFSCKKTDDSSKVSEVEIIQEFMKQQNLSIEPTKTGLYFQDMKVGSGNLPVLLDTVDVYYLGTFLNGRKFDSNVGSKKTYQFIVGKNSVIQGWEEGIKLMKKGGKAKLIIPSSLAYGSKGSGSIPAYTPLYFEIELVGIINGPNH